MLSLRHMIIFVSWELSSKSLKDLWLATAVFFFLPPAVSQNSQSESWLLADSWLPVPQGGARPCWQNPKGRYSTTGHIPRGCMIRNKSVQHVLGFPHNFSQLSVNPPTAQSKSPLSSSLFFFPLLQMHEQRRYNCYQIMNLIPILNMCIQDDTPQLNNILNIYLHMYNC